MEEMSAHTPLPEEFWSFETGAPMENCRLCGHDLTRPGENHLIEKAFQNGETIFEHALCLECYTKCHNEMSAESKIRIRDYFAERVDLKARHRALMEQHGTNHRHWISHCMVKGYPVAECGEYQLYGFCIDKDLVFSGAPYVLCGEVVEEILELLSPETLGVLNNLSARLFGINAPQDLFIL